MTAFVGITGYLAWEGQQAARGQKEEIEFMRKQLEAREAAKPVKPASSFAPVSTEPVISPITATSTPAPIAEAAPTPLIQDKVPAAALTALQKQVLGMPTLAVVTQVERNQGFVVVNAGKNKKWIKGQKFDVRRRDGVVGRVTISEVIEETESVADIDSSVSLPGARIEAGDELILPVTK
ncbi:MAG: hypothetical protein ACKO8Z_09575 [Prosthecobacter sp.]